MRKTFIILSLIGLIFTNTCMLQVLADPIIKSKSIIENKLQTYEKEIKELETKSRLGIDIDREKLRLLQYKVDELAVLQGRFFYLTCNGRTKTVTGVKGLNERYNSAQESLKSKVITKEDYQIAIDKIEKDDEDLLKKYNILISLSGIPFEERAVYCEEKPVQVEQVKVEQEEDKYSKTLENFSKTIDAGQKLKNLF